jgi:hypothetical protein
MSGSEPGSRRGLYGKRSKGLCAGTPNGTKWRRLRVSTVNRCAAAVAAIARSGNPGVWRLLRAKSDSAPAMRAAGTSNGNIRLPYRCTTVSSHFAKRAAFARAPWRRAFAIPSSISATVIVERKSPSEFRPIHVISATEAAPFEDAPAEMTSVSTRYTSYRTGLRSGLRLRLGKSPFSRGAAIRSRPKDGIRESRCHS